MDVVLCVGCCVLYVVFWVCCVLSIVLCVGCVVCYVLVVLCAVSYMCGERCVPAVARRALARRPCVCCDACAYVCR